MEQTTQHTVKPLLKVEQLVKSFSGVFALSGVDLEILPGEIHALLGENGAGKSTLLKALAGAQLQTSGNIVFQGEILNPKDSPYLRQQQGIVTIYQEFNLLPNMTVVDNLFLGRESTNAMALVEANKLKQQAIEILKRVKLNISPDTQVSRLSVAQQQMLEIARALTLNAKLIIMDEPSAALSEKEVEQLHQIVLDLKKSGISVIYVTHRLNEVLQICDRFTVLQDGKFSGTGTVKDVTVADIIRMMVGRDVAFERRDSSLTHHPDAPIMLEVKGLNLIRDNKDALAISLHDINFSVKKGEVLGFAGLVGAGRTEIARCLFGVDNYQAESITLDGKDYHAHTPLEALEQGIALVPEDRKKEGLILNLPIATNLTLSKLKDLLTFKFFIKPNKEKDLIEAYRQALSIKMANPNLEARKLSGGNQQKIILARCMSLNPKVLIVDEPTRGIDVGAKSEVHQVIFDLAKQGAAVIVISSDLPEIMAISDRIITISEGRITGELHGDQATEEKLMSLMAIGIDRNNINI